MGESADSYMKVRHDVAHFIYMHYVLDRHEDVPGTDEGIGRKGPQQGEAPPGQISLFLP